VKKQTSADIVGDVFSLSLAWSLCLQHLRLRRDGGTPSSSHPPLCRGLDILVSGIILAIKSFRFKGENPTIQWPDRQGTVRILITLIGLIFYIALMTPLGLPLSTFLYVTFSVWYLGRYRILYAFLIGFVSGPSPGYCSFICWSFLSYGPFQS